MKRLQRQIASCVENKNYDLINDSGPGSVNGDYIDWTGRIYALQLNLQQGNANDQRIGSKIRVSSLEFAWMILYDFTGIEAITYPVRTIIFIWKSDTVPTTSDILAEVPLPAFYAEYRILSSYNTTNTPLYEVLYDKILTTQAYYDDTIPTSQAQFAMGSTREQDTVIIDYMDRGKDLNLIQFLPPDADILPDKVINGLYVLQISDLDPSAGAAAWHVAMYSRINYVDY